MQSVKKFEVKSYICLILAEVNLNMEELEKIADDYRYTFETRKHSVALINHFCKS